MNFFVLDSGSSRNYVPLFDAADSHEGCDKIWCDVCGIRGLSVARRALAVVVSRIGVLDDIEDCLTSSLVTARFRDAVHAAGLTGMEFFSLVSWSPKRREKSLVEFTNTCASMGYEVAWAHGDGGTLARTCGVRCAAYCNVCGWVDWTLPEASVVVEEESWDGSDFFRLRELPGPIVMTERAVRVLADAGLSNFGAVPTHEWYPDFVKWGFTRRRQENGPQTP